MNSVHRFESLFAPQFLMAQAMSEADKAEAQKQSVSNYLALQNKYLRVNLRLMGALVKAEQYHNEIAKVRGEMEKIKSAKDTDYVHFKRILDAYENEKKLTEEEVTNRQKAVDEYRAYLGTLGDDFEVEKLEAADLVKLGLFKVENADTVELAVPQIERLKVELAPGRGLSKDLKNLKAKQLRVWQEILHVALKMNKFIDELLEGKAPYRDESESRLEREA